MPPVWYAAAGLSASFLAGAGWLVFGPEVRRWRISRRKKRYGGYLWQ